MTTWNFVGTQKKQICHADREVCRLRCIIFSSHQSNSMSSEMHHFQRQTSVLF